MTDREPAIGAKPLNQLQEENGRIKDVLANRMRLSLFSVQAKISHNFTDDLEISLQNLHTSANTEGAFSFAKLYLSEYPTAEHILSVLVKEIRTTVAAKKMLDANDILTPLYVWIQVCLRKNLTDKQTLQRFSKTTFIRELSESMTAWMELFIDGTDDFWITGFEEALTESFTTLLGIPKLL